MSLTPAQKRRLEKAKADAEQKEFMTAIWDAMHEESDDRSGVQRRRRRPAKPLRRPERRHPDYPAMPGLEMDPRYDYRPRIGPDGVPLDQPWERPGPGYGDDPRVYAANIMRYGHPDRYGGGRVILAGGREDWSDQEIEDEMERTQDSIDKWNAIAAGAGACAVVSPDPYSTGICGSAAAAGAGMSVWQSHRLDKLEDDKRARERVQKKLRRPDE